MPEKTKTREPLSRDRIVAAAMGLADAEGLDKLSMRRLATALGVEAMSLYNHVAGKEDLLDAMVEAVVARFHPPRPGGDWIAELRARALAAHAALSRHPWAAQLLLGRINAGPAMLAYVDATLGCLRAAGFSWLDADRIWNAIDSHVYGFTLQEQKFPFRPEEYAAVAAAYLPQIPQDVLPHMHALTVEVAEGRHHGAQNFTFGLDLLLGAIARMAQDGEQGPIPVASM